MKQKVVQSAFLTGVLDPRASARVGTDAYDNGLLLGENVVPVHLGGVRRRPGLRFLQQLPGVLTFTAPSSATAPEGGTAANGYDQSLTTLVTTVNNVSTTNPYVVVRYDLGSAVAISHADVLRIRSTGSTSTQFRIQFSQDDALWGDFGDPFPMIDTSERTYRRTSFSVEGALFPTTARYWRVVRVGATDMGANQISLAGFELWADSGVVSNVRLLSFELNTDARYIVALTDRSATVFVNGAIPDSGTLPMPYASADLADLDAVVGADALLMVHEDHAPRYVLDEFSGEDLQTDTFAFTNVPQYDFDDASSPTPTSEVQRIVLSAGWIRGDSFQIELDGARTAAIAYAGDASAVEQAATAGNIAREVQKLYTVPGFDGVSCVRSGALTYDVTFASSSAKPYGLLTVVPLITGGTATATGTVTQTTPGVSRHEPAWSATRGYPRTTTFFEGRWFFGGTRSLPQTLFGSAVNDIGNFEILEALDGDAVQVTLDGQQTNAINGLYSGRSFQMFTSGGEFRYIKQPGNPITPADAPKNQTQYGSAKIRPVAVDGATIFVQRTRKAIRDFKYTLDEDAYASLGLSSLAPHLINGVVDIAAWTGSSTDEINLVFVVNGDGTVALLNTRREADVLAWTQWFTGASAVADEDTSVVSGHDKFKAVATTVDEVYFATRRTIDGTDKLFLEILDDDMYVDAGVNVTGGVASNVVHLANETCRVRLRPDHLVLADSVGGTVTPASPYEGSAIQVGLNFNPKVRPMPLNGIGAGGRSLIKKQRVVNVAVRVRNTIGLILNEDRILADRFYDIDDFDATITPSSGNFSTEETSNWDDTEDKLVTFSQVDPLPMEILGIQVILEAAE